MSASEVAEPTLQGALNLLATLDLGVEVVVRCLSEITQGSVDDEIARLRRSPAPGLGRVGGLACGCRLLFGSLHLLGL